MATATPITYKFETPCCCDEEPQVCDPGGVQVVNLTITNPDGTKEVIPMNWFEANGSFVAGVGANAVITCNPDTGVWTASGTTTAMGWTVSGSANSPNAIPQSVKFDGTIISFS